MRTIRLIQHIALDGIIAPEGDDAFAHGGWMVPFRSPAGREAVTHAYGAGFDLLLGRRTYDLWSAFWPQAPRSPIGDQLNAARKYVVTHRPDSLQWGPAEAVGGEGASALQRLRASAGPDLVVSGSSTLIPLLLEQGIVDDLTFIIYPILLGSGTRCFPAAAPAWKLASTSSQALPNGVVLQRYRLLGALPRQ